MGSKQLHACSTKHASGQERTKLRIPAKVRQACISTGLSANSIVSFRDNLTAGKELCALIILIAE